MIDPNRGSSREGPLFLWHAAADKGPRYSTIPPSRLRRATSLYTREAFRCGGDGRTESSAPTRLDAIKGSLSAAAGIAPPVACGDSPLLVEGAFERTTLHNQHDRNLANLTCKMQILLRPGLSAQTLPLLPCASIYFAISAKMQQDFQIFASRISLLYTNFKYPPPEIFSTLLEKAYFLAFFASQM